MKTNVQPVGYRFEWKPADYVFMTATSYTDAVCKESARIWGLFAEPQPGCDAAIEVYFGEFWVQPKWLHGRDLFGFAPLYLGPIISEPQP